MKILLVGASGYGAEYIGPLLRLSPDKITWEGIVDPFYAACSHREEIDRRKIPVYDTMEAFYTEHSADLAIIATPPYLHREHSICALSHGSHVLCEKPAAPTLADARAMLEAEEKYHRWIAIGYQWSFSEAIQRLKADILKGALGAPVSLKTAISWPRTLGYYGRGTKWGGRISRDGKLILDSIASNACAHYLHNMLFVLGDKENRSAEVTGLKGQCFRANDIENFDTCALTMTTADGVPLYFVASHAAETQRNPEFVYSFDKADVIYSQDEEPIIQAVFHDGHRVLYGDPFANNFKKLTDCVECVKKGTAPVCTVETAMPHTGVIERIYRELPIRNFPEEQICFLPEENRICVRGLFQRMYAAYETGTMLY